MKIFVASLCSSFLQCPTLSCDAILKDVWDNKIFLLTSDLRFQDDFSPRTYFGLSYTIFISSSYTIHIITLFDHPQIGWYPLGHRPNSHNFNSTFWIIGPHNIYIYNFFLPFKIKIWTLFNSKLFSRELVRNINYTKSVGKIACGE